MDLFVAQFFRNFLGLRHPDPTVVAQRFRHQRQFRLIVARNRNAGRVNLRVARIGKKSTTTCRAPCCGDVASHRIGREEKHIAIATRGHDHCVGRVRRNFPGDQITHNNPFGMSVHQNEIQHLRAGIHLHPTLVHFFFQSLIATNQQLLPSLTTSIERTGNLSTAE